MTMEFIQIREFSS